MKRALCVILIISMLLSMLTGCSDGDSAKHDDTIVIDGLTIDTTTPDRTGLYDLYWIPLPEVESNTILTADAVVSYDNQLLLPAEQSNGTIDVIAISLTDFSYEQTDLEFLSEEQKAGTVYQFTPTWDGGYFGVLDCTEDSDGSIYFIRWDNKGKQVMTYDVLTPAIETAEDILPFPESETDLHYTCHTLRNYDYCIPKDGRIYAFTNQRTGSKFYSIWSSDGSFVYRGGLMGWIGSGGSNGIQAMTDTEGNMVVNHVIRSVGAWRYYTTPIDSKAIVYGDETPLPESVTDITQLATGFDAYQITKTGVQAHRYHADPVMLLNWVDYDIRYDDVTMVKVLSADRILVAVKDKEHDTHRFGLFSAENIEGQIAEQLNANKTELTLAYIASGNAGTVKTIENYVTEFNIDNPDYRVKLLAYKAVGSESAEDMLISDILTGKIPDMILFDSDMNYRRFDSFDLFCDMYGFMDKDETYNRGAFWNCVKTPFENADGELPYLTVQFGISTLSASKETVGDIQSWTIPQMAEFAASLGKERRFIDIAGLGTSDAPMALLKVLLPNTLCHYVDYENAKITFGGDLAKLLEFCKTANVSLSNNGVPPTMYTDGTVAINAMGNIKSVQTFLAVRHAYFSGNAMTYLGFPTNGDCGSVIVPMTSLAITKKSANLDGAWKFITACLDYQREEWVYDMKPQELADGKQPMMNPETGFSCVIDTVRLMCETLKHYFFFINIAESVDNPGHLAITRSAGGMHFAADGGYGDSAIVANIRKNPSATFYSIAEDDAENLLELLHSITMVRSLDTDLLDIIYEDASYYFNGTKSLDETVRIIENRVGIKLAE